MQPIINILKNSVRKFLPLYILFCLWCLLIVKISHSFHDRSSILLWIFIPFILVLLWIFIQKKFIWWLLLFLLFIGSLAFALPPRDTSFCSLFCYSDKMLVVIVLANTIINLCYGIGAYYARFWKYMAYIISIWLLFLLSLPYLGSIYRFFI